MARDWKPLASLAFTTLAVLVVAAQATDVPQWAGPLLAPLPILLFSAFKESSNEAAAAGTAASTRNWRSFWRICCALAATLVIASQAAEVAHWSIHLLAPLPVLMVTAVQGDNNKVKAS
ncbi:putative cleavage induced protein [Globisporangium polare]